MHNLSFRGLLAAATVAALVTFGATSAGAATVYYSSYVTGDNLGLQNTAILTATQNGADVDFALENTLTGQPADAFIGAIGFSYGGSDPSTVVDLAGSEAVTNGFGNGGLNGGGLSIDFAALFLNQPSNRLAVGETALFRILNVSLALFDFTAPETAVHLQGLNGPAGSSKYTSGTNIAPVPVPASLPILLTVLVGGGAFLRRRAQKTT